MFIEVVLHVEKKNLKPNLGVVSCMDINEMNHSDAVTFCLDF
jgi:hypothetical protein